MTKDNFFLTIVGQDAGLLTLLFGILFFPGFPDSCLGVALPETSGGGELGGQRTKQFCFGCATHQRYPIPS